MIDVCEYFNLDITTTHAAIAYLDRLQPNEKFSRFEWQMMAICCILISSKYNECEEHVPPLRKLEEITQQRIGNDVLLNYELYALKKMSWKLNGIISSLVYFCSSTYFLLSLHVARTVTAFMASYDKLGLLTIEETDAMSSSAITNTEDILAEMKETWHRMCSKVLLDPKFKNLHCSSVAAAMVYYVRTLCYPPSSPSMPMWPEKITQMVFHDLKQHRATQTALTWLCAMENEEGAAVFALLQPMFANQDEDVSLVMPPAAPDIPLPEASSPFKSMHDDNALATTPIAVSTSLSGKDNIKDHVSPVSIAAFLD